MIISSLVYIKLNIMFHNFLTLWMESPFSQATKLSSLLLKVYGFCCQYFMPLLSIALFIELLLSITGWLQLSSCNQICLLAIYSYTISRLTFPKCKSQSITLSLKKNKGYWLLVSYRTRSKLYIDYWGLSDLCLISDFESSCDLCSSHIDNLRVPKQPHCWTVYIFPIHFFN